MSEGFPKIIGGIAGMANGIIADPTSAGRLASKFAGAVANEIVSTLADNEAISELDAHQAKELIQARSSLQIVQLEGKAEEAIRLDALRTLIGQEPILRHQLYQQQELVHQHAGRYASLLAKGNRLVEERSRLRRQTAIEIREFRYRDAAFRIFRTDALRHYRAQFDLAAFYTYMAARAYDYETNLSPDDPRRPANDPLARIVRARTLGVVGNGAVPSEGSLAGILSDLDRHFLQVRDLMNFNNPQGQRLQLSLRTGQFRIEDDPAHPGRETSAQWRQTLRRHLVPRLEDDPELVRYCGELPKGPGLVIPFATPLYLDNGRNFFGWPAGGGDVNFNPSLYGSKIRSIGVHFSGYRADSSRGLRATPYIYLIPVGADLFRTPAGAPQDEEFPGLRSWLVSDLQIPLPVDVRGKNFQGTLSNQHDLSPRKFAPFEAVYQDSYIFGEKKVVVDTQLIGRSIHNTRWLLVIPGHNLLAGRASEGLDRFIDGLPSGTQETGQGGVSDILFDIRVYSVPGR